MGVATKGPVIEELVRNILDTRFETFSRENIEDVKNRMQASRKYSWQVKAFSPQGTLLAVSPRVQFKITSTE